jgi:HEAT repeat protein
MHTITALATVHAWGAAVPPLVLALKDKDPRLRAQAALALGNFKSGAVVTVPALSALLEDSEIEPRKNAIRALASLCPASGAFSALCRALTDPDAQVASAARDALDSARVRPGREDVPALSKALGSESLQIRSYAAVALGTLGPDAKEAVPVLANGLGDPVAAFRVAVAEALAGYPPTAHRAGPERWPHRGFRRLAGRRQRLVGR